MFFEKTKITKKLCKKTHFSFLLSNLPLWSGKLYCFSIQKSLCMFLIVATKNNIFSDLCSNRKVKCFFVTNVESVKTYMFRKINLPFDFGRSKSKFFKTYDQSAHKSSKMLWKFWQAPLKSGVWKNHDLTKMKVLAVLVNVWFLRKNVFLLSKMVVSMIRK